MKFNHTVVLVAFACGAVLDAHTVHAQLAFYPPVQSPASFDPQVVGDFNGDGWMDLASRPWWGGGLVVHLGDGAGHFNEFGRFAIGGLERMRAGDVTGDGRADLLYWVGETLMVLPSTGAGTLFGDPLTIAEVNSQLFPILADVNEDGRLDVMVWTMRSEPPWAPYQLALLLNGGDGDWSEPSYFAAGFGNALPSIEAGDVNADGHVDVVFAGRQCPIDLWNCYGQVRVLIGDGAGGFSNGPVSDIDDRPAMTFRLGHMDRDGKVDAALASYYQGVTILRGDGNGRFSFAAYRPVQNGGLYAVADFDDDGLVDVAAMSSGSGSYVTSSLGVNRNLLSGEAWVTAAGSVLYPRSLLAGDFNNDGRADLVTNDSVAGKLIAVLSAQAPELDAGADIDVFTNSFAVATVTLNGRLLSNAAGLALSYAWRSGDTLLGTGISQTVTLPPGEYRFTFTATSARSSPVEDSVTVRVHLPQATLPPPPAGVLLFLEAGSPAPAGYTLVGTYDLAPSGGSRGRNVMLKVDVYRRP